jgi:hypothetical protein
MKDDAKFNGHKPYKPCSFNNLVESPTEPVEWHPDEIPVPESRRPQAGLGEMDHRQKMRRIPVIDLGNCCGQVLDIPGDDKARCQRDRPRKGS